MSITTDFPGALLGIDKYDELALINIRKDWREDEVQLMRSKWFDYRFLHPTAATYLYAHLYIAVYRNAFRQNVDAEIAERLRVFKKENVFKLDKTTIAGLWRGRQHADAMGIPYEIYLAIAFKERLRFWKRSHLPRPTQLYQAEVVARIAEEWEQRKRSRLFYSKLEPYLVGAYAGTHEQDSHHEWLMDQAGTRKAPAHVLHRFISEGLIPLEKVVTRFGDEIAEQIRLAA